MPRWQTSATCSHANNDVCRVCDFDRYYANKYPECPWNNGPPGHVTPECDEDDWASVAFGDLDEEEA